MGDNRNSLDTYNSALKYLNNIAPDDQITPIKKDIANIKNSIQNNVEIIKDTYNNTIRHDEDIDMLDKYIKGLRIFTYINLAISSISLILSLILTILINSG